jgi:type I restriction enzyme S subunit
MALVKGFALSLIERAMAFNQDLKALVPRDGLSGAFLMYALTFAGQRMLRNVADAAHGTNAWHRRHAPVQVKFDA